LTIAAVSRDGAHAAEPGDSNLGIRPSPRPKQRGIPACCALDSACCEAQTTRDEVVPTRLVREPFQVDFKSLHLAQHKSDASDELGFYDERGQPHLAPIRPGITQFVPPGLVGFISIGDDMNFHSGFFLRDEGNLARGAGTRRALGFGVAIDSAWSYPMVQPLAWRSLDRGADGAFVFRSFDGKLDRSTGKTSGRSLTAKLTDVADGWVYAFRSRDDSGRESVHFVIEDGAIFGGFGPGPLLSVALSVDEGSADVANVGVSKFEREGVRITRPKGGPMDAEIQLSASRGEGDAEPLVMIAFTGAPRDPSH
jgi:hypothetical protein